MLPPTQLRDGHTYGSENLRSAMQKGFFDSIDSVRALGESDGLDDRRHKPRRRELLNRVVRLLFRNISPGGSTAHLLGLICCYTKLISQKFGLQLHHFVYVLGIH
jgi:hypothetical protein